MMPEMEQGVGVERDQQGAKAQVLDARMYSARKILAECFWGDYVLSPEEMLSRLDQGEAGFDRFIFSKIIENSRQPSRHLQILFPRDVLLPLLDRYLLMSAGKKRIRLVAANITGRWHYVPELQWKK